MWQKYKKDLALCENDQLFKNQKKRGIKF